MKEYTITEAVCVLDFLKKINPDSSNQTLRSFLKNKRVYVDDTLVVRADFMVKENQLLSIRPFKKKISHNVEILYEDDWCLLVNKPEGLLSYPLDKGGEINLLTILKKKFTRSQVFPVHRIDRDTSGVMIFAKGRNAYYSFKKMFENHDFKRIYFAVVEGKVFETRGTWKSHLIEKKIYG